MSARKINIKHFQAPRGHTIRSLPNDMYSSVNEYEYDNYGDRCAEKKGWNISEEENLRLNQLYYNESEKAKKENLERQELYGKQPQLKKGDIVFIAIQMVPGRFFGSSVDKNQFSDPKLVENLAKKFGIHVPHRGYFLPVKIEDIYLETCAHYGYDDDPSIYHKFSEWQQGPEYYTVSVPFDTKQRKFEMVDLLVVPKDHVAQVCTNAHEKNCSVINNLEYSF